MGDPARILVVLPNWVGDVVLATPALTALRRRFAAAHIGLLLRDYVADVVADGGFADDVLTWPPHGAGPAAWWSFIRRLRARRFDLALLFPNSFRSALTIRLSAARRRVGYARDGRGWLLTDRLHPRRSGGKWAVESMLDYYGRLVEALGCDASDRRPRLGIGPADDAACARRFASLDENRPLVVLNPGGAFGTAKLWPAERFAAIGDALTREFNAQVVASGTPKERSLGEAIARAARLPVTLCFDPPVGLGPLKALIRRADLLVTNDTGPRHYAIALGTPVVTVFGPTDPGWTETHFHLERKVMLALDCQPCQKKRCPLGHTNCMMQLDADQVLVAARALLAERLARRRATAGAVR